MISKEEILQKLNKLDFDASTLVVDKFNDRARVELHSLSSLGFNHRMFNQYPAEILQAAEGRCKEILWKKAEYTIRWCIPNKLILTIQFGKSFRDVIQDKIRKRNERYKQK